MSNAAIPLSQKKTWPQSVPFYYGWINVIVASAAMTATLPGRTHGLGLITEPLLRDLALERLTFARINLVTSLLGAAFCVPVGWLIDRFGVRSVLTTVTAALGISVLAMSQVHAQAWLILALLFVRGFGQSALSVVSIAVVGKWFRARLGIAMGVFSVLLTFGVVAAVSGVGYAVKQFGWRSAWEGVGIVVLVHALLFWIFCRSTPESAAVEPDEPQPTDTPTARAESCFTLRQAVATPAFWVVALGTCAFNLVWSGVTLFNEAMLAEHGLNADFAVQILAILTGVGLIANFIGGALATRERVIKLLGVSMLLLAAGLAAFPAIGGANGARLYAVAIDLSGGIVTVVFFAAWGHLFGRAHLGRIQGAAQLATVLASAFGPELMEEIHARTGSYAPAFLGLAAAVAALAVAALVTPTPRWKKAD